MKIGSTHSKRQVLALPFVLLAFILCINAAPGLCATSPKQNTQKPIVIVTANWPPYAIDHSKTMQQGMDVEVALTVFERADIDVEIRFYTWSRCLDEIEEGRATALLEITDTPLRKKYFFISKPLSVSTGVALVRKDYSGPPLSAVKDLTSLNVGVVSGYAVAKNLTGKNIAYDISRNEETAIRKVADRRLDVTLLELRNMLYLTSKLGLDDRFKWFAGSDTYSFHLGISKKWPGAAELLKVFNKGLNAIIKDGTYDAIHARYQ